ncbi:AaceriABL157Wp [[Ashbya] aceris (nom. inval.)]|nr:AaceriABL157Wp [[Ashbya] aceris (nom. inval.)]
MGRWQQTGTDCQPLPRESSGSGKRWQACMRPAIFR